MLLQYFVCELTFDLIVRFERLRNDSEEIEVCISFLNSNLDQSHDWKTLMQDFIFPKIILTFTQLVS